MAPVLVGVSLAWSEGATPNWTIFAATLCAALSIQVGTNLYNDVRDGERGGDGPGRTGPIRVTASGLATPRQVRLAAHTAFALAFSVGLLLVTAGGWPILAIGLASLAAGYAYSGGPRPLSHAPWGEVFVLLFFGLAAVAGSHYLQAAMFSSLSLWLGIALGSQAAAVLLVNNVRDLEVDRKAGRATLAGLVGGRRARYLYALLMLFPFMLLPFLPGMRGMWLPMLLLPLCLWLAWLFLRMPSGPAMNIQLARTAQVQVVFAVAIAASLLLGR